MIEYLLLTLALVSDAMQLVIAMLLLAVSAGLMAVACSLSQRR